MPCKLEHFLILKNIQLSPYNVAEDWLNSVEHIANLSLIVYFKFKNAYHYIYDNTDLLQVEAVVVIKIVHNTM